MMNGAPQLWHMREPTPFFGRAKVYHNIPWTKLCAQPFLDKHKRRLWFRRGFFAKFDIAYCGQDERAIFASYARMPDSPTTPRLAAFALPVESEERVPDGSMLLRDSPKYQRGQVGAVGRVASSALGFFSLVLAVLAVAYACVSGMDVSVYISAAALAMSGLSILVIDAG
jgi:hypothetical protein